MDFGQWGDRKVLEGSEGIETRISVYSMTKIFLKNAYKRSKCSI